MKYALTFLLAAAILFIVLEFKPLPTKHTHPLPVTHTHPYQQIATLVDKMKLTEKEKKFIAKVLPAIIDIHNKYENYYRRAKAIITSKKPLETDMQWLAYMKKSYDVQSDEALLRALKPFPQSITLAQAALESGWGSSYFFHKGNNIFGVHAFSPDVPRIEASQENHGHTVWVRKYANLDGSINGYYYFLATKRAFEKFRELKMQTDDPYKITQGLYLYSALGKRYSRLLNEMIKNHRFYAADAP